MHTRAISGLVHHCLFTDEEVASGVAEQAILVEGPVRKFAFHPERLKGIEPALTAIIKDLVRDPFFEGKGDGWSFLYLPIGHDGEPWGTHSASEELLCLALASGKAKYCMPKEVWPFLPGGMPYIVFRDLAG